MLRRTGFVLTASAALLVLAGDEARAAFGNFTYDVGVAAVSGAVAPAAPAVGAGPIVVDIGNGNAITFSGNPAAMPIDATLPGGADINFGSVMFNPSTTNGTATPYTVSYNYTVAVTDVSGGDTHDFNFTGSITGTAMGNGTASINSTVFNFAVAPPSQPYLQGVYNALNKGGTGPGSSGGTLTEGRLQGNISAVPEPASLVLIGLGGLLAVARRRRAA